MKLIRYPVVFAIIGTLHYLILTKMLMMKGGRINYFWEQGLLVKENFFDQVITVIINVLMMPAIALDRFGIASDELGSILSILSYALFGTLVFWVASRVFKW